MHFIGRQVMKRKIPYSFSPPDQPHSIDTDDQLYVETDS